LCAAFALDRVWGQDSSNENDDLEAALEEIRLSPGDSNKWETIHEIFDGLIADDAADGLMDIALGLTEEFDQRGDAWCLLGKVYLGQAGAIRGLTGFEGTFRQSLLYQAADAFRTALDRQPSLLKAGNHLAFSLFLLKNFTGARREARALAETYPGEAYPVYILAEIELRCENPEAALRLFRDARGKNENLLDAIHGEVRALIALEKFQEAADLTVELITRAPARAETAPLAYSVFEPRESYNDAALLYHRLLEVAPRRLDVLFYLAVVEYRLEEIASSRGHIAEIVKSDPSFDGAHYFEGLLGEKLRLYDEAVASYRAELEKEGRYFELSLDRLKILAFTKAANGLYEEAIEIYDSLLPILPFDSILAANRALALAQCGRIDEADRAYELILETSPRDSAVLNDRALHMMGTGRTERALEMLEQAYSIDGNLDSCENLGAYYLFVAKDLEKAAQYLGRVLEADPRREKSLILGERVKRRFFGQRGD